MISCALRDPEYLSNLASVLASPEVCNKRKLLVFESALIDTST